MRKNSPRGRDTRVFGSSLRGTADAPTNQISSLGRFFQIFETDSSRSNGSCPRHLSFSFLLLRLVSPLRHFSPEVE